MVILTDLLFIDTIDHVLAMYSETGIRNVAISVGAVWVDSSCTIRGCQLARILHEGNEAQGKHGKQGWSIARRCIAVATHQGGSINIDSQIFPDFVQVKIVFLIIHDIHV